MAEVSETLSRSELLKARGYDEVSQDGSTPAVVNRECAICHRPVPADRPKGQHGLWEPGMPRSMAAGAVSSTPRRKP